MDFKYKKLGISAGNMATVIMLEDDAFKIGAKSGDRVILYPKNKQGQRLNKNITAVVEIALRTEIIQHGEIGLFDETFKKLEIDKNKDDIAAIEIQISEKPITYEYIKNKIRGKTLSTHQIQSIINDVTEGKLLPIEIAAFITAMQINGANDNEIVDLTLAMTHSGDVVKFDKEVFDKHSTGGVPGNKVSLIIVPIVSAAGLFIPKTSTRAITSPSGTADSMEVLANVAFSREKVIELLKKVNGAILWGGALDFAPADNALINIEKPLNMDPFPLMIASILCKKLAMGVNKMVLDIPCGQGTKFPTIEDGRKYAMLFKSIAKRVGIDVICMLTSAQQPIGHAVGPALEAREALRLLQKVNGVSTSLLNKSTELAGVLLEMGGKAPEGKGKEKAIETLKSGKAYEQMKKIIRNQGGNPNIQPEDIEVGPYVQEIIATKEGFVTEVDNKSINQIAKIAGCPGSKTSGIEIGAKIGTKVRKGDVIFRIYSDSEDKLRKATEFYYAHPPQILGGMTLERI
ncbi:MAG: AMP phosphorylase [Promethearchaeota archaeon]